MQDSLVRRNSDDLQRDVLDIEPVLTTTVPANLLGLNTVTKSRSPYWRVWRRVIVTVAECMGQGWCERTHANPGDRLQPGSQDVLSTLVWDGQCQEVALIACRQKLVTTLNPKRKHRTPWGTEQPQHASPSRQWLTPPSMALHSLDGGTPNNLAVSWIGPHDCSVIDQIGTPARLYRNYSGVQAEG